MEIMTYGVTNLTEEKILAIMQKECHKAVIVEGRSLPLGMQRAAKAIFQKLSNPMEINYEPRDQQKYYSGYAYRECCTESSNGCNCQLSGTSWNDSKSDPDFREVD